MTEPAAKISYAEIDRLFELSRDRKQLQAIVANMTTIQQDYCNEQVNKANPAVNLACATVRLYFEKKLLECENELRAKGITL